MSKKGYIAPLALISVLLLLLAIPLTAFVLGRPAGSQNTASKASEGVIPTAHRTIVPPLPQSPTDTTAPTVSIVAPLNNELVGKNSKIAVKATASDNIAIVKTIISVNGNKLTNCAILLSSDIYNYTCSFNTNNQSGQTYIIQAQTFDRASNSAQSSVTVSNK